MDVNQPSDGSCQNQEVQEIISVIQGIVNAVECLQKWNDVIPEEAVRSYRAMTSNEVPQLQQEPSQRRVQILQSPSNSPLQCPKCGIGFTCASMLTTHSKICRGYNRVTTTTNGKVQITSPAPWFRLLPVSAAATTTSASKTTVLSRYKTKAWFIAQKSENRDTAKNLICPLCNKSIHPTRPLLELHLRRHFQEYIYSCELCDHPFIAFGELVIHAKTCQNIQPLPEPPPKQAETSAKVTEYDPSTLETHGSKKTMDDFERIRTNTKAYKISQAAQRDNRRVFNCEVCNRYYSFQRSQLEYHLRKHFQEHVYFCAKCQLGFFTLSQSKLHDCGPGQRGEHQIKRKQTLLQRMVDGALVFLEASTNSQQKAPAPVKTSPATALLDQTTSEKTEAAYPRNAEGERPYKCTVCEARFSRSSALVRHMKVRHKPKTNEIRVDTTSQEANQSLTRSGSSDDQLCPFSCESCQRGFFNKAAYSRHMKNQLCRDNNFRPSGSSFSTPKKPSKLTRTARRIRFQKRSCKRETSEVVHVFKKPLVSSSTPSPPVLKAMTEPAEDEGSSDDQDLAKDPPTLQRYPKVCYVRKDRHFQCKSCPRGFFSKVAFAKHVKICCEEIPLEIQTKERKSKLNKKLVSNKYPWLHEFLNGPYCYECKECDCKFTRVLIAKEHKQWHRDWDLKLTLNAAP